MNGVLLYWGKNNLNNISGPLATPNWSGFHPIIADFIAENVDRVAPRKSEIDAREWDRTFRMGKEYLDICNQKYEQIAENERPQQIYRDGLKLLGSDEPKNEIGTEVTSISIIPTVGGVMTIPGPICMQPMNFIPIEKLRNNQSNSTTIVDPSKDLPPAYSDLVKTTNNLENTD